MGKYVFESHFAGDDQKNAILAPLMGQNCFRGTKYTLSSLDNAEQFSIDVSLNMFYSKAKSRSN